MPEWEGPETMLPAFEGCTDAGEVFRTRDRKQHRHLVVAFAKAPDDRLGRLEALADEIRENTGDVVIVAPPGVDLGLPGGVPVVRDEGGAIAASYRPILPEWHPPVIFVGDRYGELMATADTGDEAFPEHVAQWIFSAEVQCSL